MVETGRKARDHESQFSAPPKRPVDPRLPSGLQPRRPPAAVALRLRMDDAAAALAGALARERDEGTLFHLAPVALALGSIAYFAASAEPLPGVAFASAVVLAALALRQRVHGALHHAMLAAALVFAGMAAAQLRTQAVLSPAIVKPFAGRIEGVVIAADRSRTGQARYLVHPTAMEGMSAGELPALVRLTARRHRFLAGDTIAGQARLQPFPGPAYPGGYDFRFFALYDGLGGSGYFAGLPEQGRPVALAPAAMRLRIAVNRLREAVAARIRGAAGGDNGEIAVALVTGDRSGISQAAQESLRRSGLAHILSISGVHMALLSLTVIGAIRWITAWFPALVLRHPVRKWAAAAALIAVTVYLMLSGGEVATRRSWLMLAVMLAALLLDRRAISMRNVALAALVIVATTPEAVLEPGFQMSFAATAALVAAFSAWARWREERFDEPAIPRTNPVARAAAWTLRHAGGLAATSLVAGTGSGLIALWHFHRLALWGFVGNLLAMPVVSVAVMPLALLSCLAMPYGLEAPFVRAYAASVGVVMAISDFVAGFGAPAPVGASPKSALLLVASGLAILTLLATRLRLAGLAPLAIGLAISGSETAPDIVVAGDGRTVAVADSAGKLAPLSPRRNRFVAGIWLDAWSQGLAGNRTESFAACDADRCVLRPRGRDNPVAELVYDPKRLAAACGRADILIAPRLWFVDCRGRKPQIVLKRSDFERGGTIAIRIGERDGKPFAEAIASRGQPSRPWERMFAAAAEPPDFTASRGPPGRRSGRSPPR